MNQTYKSTTKHTTIGWQWLIWTQTAQRMKCLKSSPLIPKNKTRTSLFKLTMKLNNFSETSTPSSRICRNLISWFFRMRILLKLLNRKLANTNLLTKLFSMYILYSRINNNKLLIWRIILDSCWRITRSLF